jgi:hypothetical protein
VKQGLRETDADKKIIKNLVMQSLSEEKSERDFPLL